jgi:exopolysaccharide production protein ExoQ
MSNPRMATARTDHRTRSNNATVLARQSNVHGLLAAVLRAGEVCASILILVLISDAILPLFLHSGPRDLANAPPTSLERAAYWLAYAFTMLQLLIRPMQLVRAIKRNPFVLGVVMIAAISATWSLDPDTSLRRAFALVMWTLFGYYLASRYTTAELLRILGAALALLAIISLATALLAPDYGREVGGYDNGAWRGVFTTKNALGEVMLLAAIVGGLFMIRGGRTRVIAVLGVLLAVSMIFLARATAALLTVGVLTVTIPIVLTFRRNNAAAALVLTCLLVASAAASIVVAERDAVLSVLGKEATLTGRTVLWKAVAQRIEERPVLGYGYGAFWGAGKESELVRSAVGWNTPHSHNGLLDVWLDLGLIGVLMLLAAYVLALRRAWLALRASINIEGVWAVTFLVMLFIGNTTESPIIKSFLIWVVFVTVACMRWESPRTAVTYTSSRWPTRSARK